MATILYLVHRLPYPPNKGDKVRSFHLLQHLLASHRVFLGTFIDDPADRAGIEVLRALCAGLHVAPLAPRTARLRSLRGLATRRPLTLGYYRDAGLAGWVARTLRSERCDAAVIFSSSMAQYVVPDAGLPVLVDFVDVDSAKWSRYADDRRWPLSWLYRREGRTLLAYERAVAATARRSFFVTEQETRLFLESAPECSGRVEAMGNGVDAAYFEADAVRPSPFPPDQLPVVFTGAMDYWPNIDASVWFAREVMPALRLRWPAAHFHVVGRSPAEPVRALGSASVSVSGTVPDVRPYLQHAAVVVAPLRVARGIQNKILEAMAMGCAVVASNACADTIDARIDRELLRAETADAFVDRIDRLLRDRRGAAAIGQAARARVVARYGWAANLSTIDRHLAGLPQRGDAA